MKVLYRRKMRGVSYPITTILTIVVLLAVGAALGIYFLKFKGPRAVIEPMGTPTYITASNTLKIPLKNNGDANVNVQNVTIKVGTNTYYQTNMENAAIAAGDDAVVTVTSWNSNPNLNPGDSFDVIIEFDNGAVLTLKGYAV